MKTKKIEKGVYLVTEGIAKGATINKHKKGWVAHDLEGYVLDTASTKKELLANISSY